ncbi:MAG: cellulose synthase complex outer membrane protein BcsC [Acetobacter peroxydans]|nr:cellulose synthase complex outer membrane protein BcsC [Acetobacter peroxydans]
MLTVIRKRLLLSGFVLCVSAPVLARSAMEDMLMVKLFFGENHKREDIVQDALARLDMIAANDPDVMAARIRYLVRHGRIDDARSATQRLAEHAPGSAALKSAQTSLMLATPEGRQQLQKARLLATSGHTAEALVAYRALFSGAFPSDALALEYWRVVAHTPDGKAEAIERLEVLNRDHPGNNELRLTLAGLLFSVQRSAEGFQILRPLAQSEQNREDAADMWFTQIQDMPESENRLTALKDFVTLFQTGRSADLARRMLVTETAQWLDPAFRARMHGLQNVTANNVALAEPDLRRALAQSPDDGEILGAMGIVESRRGQRARAVNLLSRAISIEPNSSNRSKWESLLQTNRYWLLINSGDAVLAVGQFAQAGLKYRQASMLDREDSYAPEGLGDVAMAQHDLAAAERFYKKALRLDKENTGVLRSLFRLYRARSTVEADGFAQHLSVRQKRAIDDLVQGMHDDMLADEARGLESHNQWAQASRIQHLRLQAHPNNPWTVYHLAKDLAGMGRVADADAVFSQAQRRPPQDATMLYAHALYLSSFDRDAEALAVLHTMPQSGWDSPMKDMAGRIALSQLLARARALREGGHEKQAIALLEAQPPSDRIDLELADWAQQDMDWKRALFYEQRVLWRNPQSLEGRLGVAEILASEGQKLAAHRNVDMAQNQHEAEIRDSLNLMRRVAYVRMVAGDRDEARRLYATLSQQAESAPPGMDSALALRDAARFDAANHHPRDALALYQHDVVASSITRVVPCDNVAFTQMTRTMDNEDWLKRGIRSDAGDLYKQQNIMVTLDYDYWGLSGNRGYSRMRAGSTMLEADGPLSDGTAQLRADFVDMTAGTFGSDSDGGYTPLWATCSTAVCHGQTHQDAMGVSLAAGWFNRTWQGDIGTTPIGMKVVTIAGGGSYRGRMGPLGFILNVHHRPLTNSLLSFGGQRDPNTGKIWGGVRATGVTWNLSYDTGGRNGVWASPGIDLLTGQNVGNNWRARWMAGYYYKIINEPNRRVTIGLSNMLWHYAQDASGYTLGRGGYYSPQEYLSFSVPVWWRQRTHYWSWEVGASISWSTSSTSSSRRYPIQRLLDGVHSSTFTDRDAIESGGSSSGLGYTAQAVIERRINPHFSVGAGIDIQEARNYTPSHAFVFLHYFQHVWDGDMDIPPQPLIPYAQW